MATEIERLAAGVADVIERYGLTVGPSWPQHLAVTGEPYVTLMNGGAKDEGALCPSIKPTAAEAVDEYLETFDAYAMYRREQTLYWRCTPNIQSDDGRYVAHSRLLVSANNTDTWVVCRGCLHEYVRPDAEQRDKACERCGGKCEPAADRHLARDLGERAS